MTAVETETTRLLFAVLRRVRDQDGQKAFDQVATHVLLSVAGVLAHERGIPHALSVLDGAAVGVANLAES